MNFLKQTIVLGVFVVPAVFAAEPAKQTAEPAAAQAPTSTAATQAPQADKPASATAGPAVRTSTAARADRLDLDTTVVTGNRELPKVLYIVPWKKADIGELPAQPFNTLLDEVLTPVDRDVFRREVTYYEAAAGGAQPAAVPNAAPAARPEK
jgi:hypothetical protein